MQIPRDVVKLLAGVALLALSAAGVRAYEGVLKTPAQMSRLAALRPMNAVVWAGDHAVAVGPRGRVLLSVGDGWKQVPVPISADLTAVHFVSASVGWAVGHDATILRTNDGGETWSLQLDGHRAARMMVEQYKAAVARGEEAADAALAESERFAANGPGRPFLGVWFRDEKTGFAVGAYNLIFRTDDGGEHWVSWFHVSDNPKLLNIYAVTGDERHVYMAGEQGLLLKLSADEKRLEALPVDYKGSYFGLLMPKPGSLLLFGLRSNVRVTHDDGAHWDKIESADPAGITGGSLLAGGQALLASQSGHLWRYDPQRSQLSPVAVSQPMPYAAVASTGGGQVLLAGFGGMRAESFDPPAAEEHGKR